VTESSAAPSAVRVRAHAKINLNLRVLAARPDGYHDLRTVFQALALHDTLTLVACPGPFGLESSSPDVPVDSSNLIWRAADLLWRRLGRSGGARDARVRVEKRIPVKAGLGGGSADAAAALLGLARLWQPDVPPADLVALGKRLGADVPFFFCGGAALGLGRGDELYPLPDLPPLAVLLVVPGFDIATAEAYRWIDEHRAGAARAGSGPGTESGERPGLEGECATPPAAPRGAPANRSIPGCTWPAAQCEIANDFEPVVSARHPEIGTIIRLLEASGAQAAAMTGSGSAVFGLFQDDTVLRAAAAVLRGSGYAVEQTRTLTRREYLHASAPVGARP
jgi:4-diphosphocytidyl-2-C-methyl-D-erythritol kinase